MKKNVTTNNNPAERNDAAAEIIFLPVNKYVFILLPLI